MSGQFARNSKNNRFPSLRAMLSRWGFPWVSSGSRMTPVAIPGRRPGAAALSAPVSIEISPAMIDPFPEPRTIPGGWDMSELGKSH